MYIDEDIDRKGLDICTVELNRKNGKRQKGIVGSEICLEGGI
jgi:hypothetical protein